MSVEAHASSALKPETVRPREGAAEQRDPEISLIDEPKPPKNRPGRQKKQSEKKAERSRKIIGPKVHRPRPRRGIPLVLYWMQQIVRRIPLLWGTEFYFSNPKLTRLDALLQRYIYLKERLKDLSESRSRTVTVLNSKGGAGKTPTIVYLAAIYHKITGSWNILLDMNQNLGTASRLLGIRKSDTLQLRDAIDLDDALTTKTDFKERTKAHRQTGLRVVASADMDSTEDEFSVEQIVNLHHKADRIFDSVFQDTGNGMSHSCNIAAVQTANALVFPAIWDNDDAITGIQETLDGYFERGYGLNIHELGYFVVLGTDPKWNKEDIFKKFGHRIFAAFSAAHHGPDPEKMDSKELDREADRLMQTLGITIDRFFMVPFSKYIKAKKVTDTTRRRMGLASKVGYLEVLVSIYENDISKDSSTHHVAENYEESIARLSEITSSGHKNKEEQ
jgi:hypothetical protein